MFDILQAAARTCVRLQGLLVGALSVGAYEALEVSRGRVFTDDGRV